MRDDRRGKNNLFHSCISICSKDQGEKRPSEHQDRILLQQQKLQSDLNSKRINHNSTDNQVNYWSFPLTFIKLLQGQGALLVRT